MVSVSEPTLSMMVEARLGGISATMALLIPWSAIAPVADQFALARGRPGPAQRGRDDVRAPAVGDVEMMVRAEVASVTMPIEAVLALKEGDLLRLTRPPRRDHAVRRQGARAHGPPGPQRQPPRRAGHGPRRAGRMSAERGPDRLGQSTAEACLGVLEMFAAGKVSHRRGHDVDGLQAGVRGRARAVRGDVGLLRRRRHRRQRLPDHARRRAQARRLDDGDGRARGPGRGPSSPSSSSPPSRRP